MKAESQITEAELEVMKILWEYGKATSSQMKIKRQIEPTGLGRLIQYKS